MFLLTLLLASLIVLFVSREYWIERILPAREISNVKAQSVQSAIFSPDGTTVFVGDGDGHIRLWDLKRATPDFDFAGPVRMLAISPKGQYLAAATSKGLEVWQVGTPQQFAPLSKRRHLPPLSVGCNTVAFIGEDQLTLRRCEGVHN